MTKPFSNESGIYQEMQSRKSISYRLKNTKKYFGNGWPNARNLNRSDRVYQFS